MFARKVMGVLVSATVLSAIALPGSASAATPADPGLVNRLLTAKQFPGYTVLSKPTIEPNTTKSGPCELADVPGTTHASVALGVARKSGSRIVSTGVTESVSELPDAAAARALFVSSRATVKKCDPSGSAKGVTIKSTVRVGPAPVVPGASHAYAFTVRTTATTLVKGKRISASGVSRAVVYLSGRYVVAINPVRAITTGTGASARVSGQDSAFTRRLGTRAATLAVANLQS